MTARRFSLSDPPFAGLTGRGVRIAVVDSGIAAHHPHVGGSVATGTAFVGTDASDTVDRIGHGTAVAAAIREKVPDAELVPVRVFGRDLATDAATLAQAIVWAVEARCTLVNLSLGTSNPAHRELLDSAVSQALEARVLIVAAYAAGETVQLPGAVPGVASVEAAPELERDEIEIAWRPGARIHCRASIYPRPIPGVLKERNLSGVSFAVANATGFLARRLEATHGEWADILDGLVPPR